MTQIRTENLKREFYVKKGMNDNYGFLLKLGGMYLGSKILPIIYILLSLIHIVCLGYTAYLCFSDLGTFSEAVHFIVLLGMACTTAINSLYYRNYIDDLFEAVGRNFYDYEDTIYDELKTEIKTFQEEANIRKKLYSNTFMGGVISCVIAIAILRPILEVYFLLVTKHNDDGVNRYVAVDCWYPLDATDPWQNLICFFLQYTVIFLTPGVVFGTDIVFLCMSEEFTVQLKILSLTLQKCQERALSMKTQETFDEKLKICVKHSIKHHIMIIKLFHELKTLNYMVLVWFMVGTSFLLCLSGLIFVSDQVGPMSKVTFFCFLGSESVHAFIFCWYGEQIQSGSLILGQCLYNSEWIESSKSMKLFMLIIQSRCLKPLKLSAGGYMEVNLNTYGNVLSSSYSYFNLLRAVN